MIYMIKSASMRINYPLLTSVLILLFLLMMFSIGVQAQTASSRPLSVTLTPLIREHLDRKPQGNNSSTAVLPSAAPLPQQAIAAKQKHAHSSSGPRPQLPSTSRATADKYRNRNSPIRN
jgi:hypothetical protein